MTDFLTNLIPGGALTWIVGALAVLGAFLWSLLRGARKAGRDEEKAKEAEARAKDMEAIIEARRAGDAAANAGSVPNDPYRRD